MAPCLRVMLHVPIAYAVAVSRVCAGKRVLLVSHGGALHAVHRSARGFAAKGKVMNCSISVLLVEPTQLALNQQQRVLLPCQLSALHEAMQRRASWHARSACHHCNGSGCACCSAGSNCCSSRSSSSSSLCKEDVGAVLVDMDEKKSSSVVNNSINDCSCGLSTGCGLSEKCFRTVKVGSGYKQALDSGGSSSSSDEEPSAAGPVLTGKLALVTFNDAVAAYELAAEGVAIHGGSFGGSSREA